MSLVKQTISLDITIKGFNNIIQTCYLMFNKILFLKKYDGVEVKVWISLMNVG